MSRVARVSDMDRCSGACDGAIAVWDGEVCLCCGYEWGTVDGSGSCTHRHMPEEVFAHAVDSPVKYPEQPDHEEGWRDKHDRIIEAARRGDADEVWSIVGDGDLADYL